MFKYFLSAQNNILEPIKKTFSVKFEEGISQPAPKADFLSNLLNFQVK